MKNSNLIQTYFPFSEASPSDEATGKEWKVTLIQAGETQKNRIYPEAVLARDGHLFKSVPVYASMGGDHDPTSRGVKSIAGYIKDTIMEETKLNGILHISDPILAASMLDWWKEGVLDKMVGLSLVAGGKMAIENGKEVVQRISKSESVDLVRSPAAGGRILELLESKATISSEEETEMTPEELKALLKESNDAMVATMDEKMKKLEEAVAVKDPPPPPPAEALPAAIKYMQTLTMAGLLKESSLPEVSRERVKSAFDTEKEVDFAAVEEMIKKEKDYLAAHEKTVVESIVKESTLSGRVTVDDLDKKLARFEALFSNPQHGFIEKDFGGEAGKQRVRPYRSFKESYIDWTGRNPHEPFGVEEMWSDWVKGIGTYDSGTKRVRERVVQEANGLYQVKLSESLGAATGTTVWGEVAADVMYQMFVNNYATQPRYSEWRKIVRITDAPDFRAQHRIKIGEYGDLPTVAEGAQYTDATHPDDEETTITVTKRGYHAEGITRELMYNDHIGALAEVPGKLAQAAARTLYKAIFIDLFQSDYTYSIGTANLFIAAKNNLGTTALSVEGLSATRVAMRSQSRISAATEILGATNLPKCILVPNELEGIAERLVMPSDSMRGRITADTSALENIDRFRGLDVIVVDEFTNAKDWWAVADPMMVTGIEVAFLGGREEPDLVIQSGS